MKRHMRVSAFIAKCANISRRRAELLIIAGRVEIGGVTRRSLGSNLLPSDTITLNGEPLTAPPVHSIVFHKPKGLECTDGATNNSERLRVIDYLPPSLVQAGCSPAGR